MLRCSKCKQVKPTSEFHVDSSRARGYSYRCKCCQRQRVRGPKPCDPESRRLLAERQRQYRIRNQEELRQKANAYRHDNREKYKAAKALQRAIRYNVIPRAADCTCADCGAQAAHWHHESYAERDWLNVVALCGSCHKKRHAEA